MNSSVPGTGSRKPWLFAGAVALLVCIVIAAVVVRSRGPHGPRLLNLPTKAREATPFTREPDARFDPLPSEPEKHEQ